MIDIIIKMDDIRQKMPNESPNLKLNKRLKKKLLSKKFNTHVTESMVF